MNTAQQQEFLLQGSIMENHRELLLNRLKGLCDMSDSLPEKFHDHEIVYALRGPSSSVPIIVAVRHALDKTNDPWHVRYIGHTDIGDKSRHTLIRNCIDSATTNNISQFLLEIGFNQEYEYVVRGYVFRKGRLKVTVSKLNKLTSAGNPESAEPLSNSYLVELSVMASHGDQIQDEIKLFAEQLKPLVILDKVDHRRLQQI